MSSTVIPSRTPVKPNSLTGSRRRSVVRSASLRSGAATMAAKSGTPWADAQSGMPNATAAANSMTRSIGFPPFMAGWGPASEIRSRRFRHREQIVAEVVGIVLSADELLPGAVLFAPARRHIHGLVERILVLDLDQRL